MSRDWLATVAGVAVLISGVITLASSAGSGPDEPSPLSTVVSASDTTDAPSGETLPLPGLPGVEAEIERILYRYGVAEAIAREQLTEVPPEVTSILEDYGAPLMVPAPRQQVDR